MERLVTRQTILVLFSFSQLNLGAGAGFALANCDWLGRTIAFYQVFFSAGEGGFGQMVYRSPERRSPQDSRDGFFLYSAQAPFSWPRVDLARPIRRACSRSFGFISFEFVKVCGIRFSICESFIGFISAAILFILCWHVYLPLEFEKVVLKGSMAAKMASRVSYLVYYYFI